MYIYLFLILVPVINTTVAGSSKLGYVSNKQLITNEFIQMLIVAEYFIGHTLSICLCHVDSVVVYLERGMTIDIT